MTLADLRLEHSRKVRAAESSAGAVDEILKNVCIEVTRLALHCADDAAGRERLIQGAIDAGLLPRGSASRATSFTARLMRVALGKEARASTVSRLAYVCDHAAQHRLDLAEVAKSGIYALERDLRTQRKRAMAADNPGYMLRLPLMIPRAVLETLQNEAQVRLAGESEDGLADFWRGVAASAERVLTKTKAGCEAGDAAERLEPAPHEHEQEQYSGGGAEAATSCPPDPASADRGDATPSRSDEVTEQMPSQPADPKRDPHDAAVLARDLGAILLETEIEAPRSAEAKKRASAPKVRVRFEDSIEDFPEDHALLKAARFEYDGTGGVWVGRRFSRLNEILVRRRGRTVEPEASFRRRQLPEQGALFPLDGS